MANFQLFNDKFAFLFRKRLGADDGGQFWKEFVEKADWTILEKTLDIIAERKENDRRANGKQFINVPGSTEIKQDYHMLLREKREAERKARGVNGCCGYCMGHGWLYCCFDENGIAVDITKPFNAPRFAGMQVAACECDKGYNIDSNATREWRHNNAKCGIPEILPPNHELQPMTGQQAFRKYFNDNWINAPVLKKIRNTRCKTAI